MGRCDQQERRHHAYAVARAWWRHPRSVTFGLALGIVACIGIYGAPAASAATRTVEAESRLPATNWTSQTGDCGSPSPGCSGGALARTFSGTSPLTFTGLAEGEVVRIYVQTRGTTGTTSVYRYRFDAGAWTTSTATSSASIVNRQLLATATVPAGATTLEVEYVTAGSSWGAYVDFIEVDDAPPPTTTTTTAAPTTTTTAAPTTTTTAAPTTTTTDPDAVTLATVNTNIELAGGFVVFLGTAYFVIQAGRRRT